MTNHTLKERIAHTFVGCWPRPTTKDDNYDTVCAYCGHRIGADSNGFWWYI